MGTVPPTSQMPWRFASADRNACCAPSPSGLADIDLVGRARAEDPEILGEHDEARAARRRRAYQRARNGEIRGDIAARYHLHGGDPERRPFSGRHPLQCRLARAAPYRHRVIPSASGPGATLAVAVPTRVTTGSDQPPVTVY